MIQSHRRGVKNELAVRAAVAGSGDSSGNLNRTGRDFLAGLQTERMQAVEIIRAIG